MDIELPKVLLGTGGWNVEENGLGDEADFVLGENIKFKFETVHHLNEERLTVEEFLQRAKGLDRPAGATIGKWLEDHPENIPENMRGKLLMFVSKLAKGGFKGILGLYYSEYYHPGPDARKSPWTPVIYLLDDKKGLGDFINKYAVVVCAEK